MRYEEAIEHLGLQAGATAEEIQAAYARLAKRAHPDTGGSTESMTRLNDAKDAALDGMGSNGLVPISMVQDLVKIQTTALDRAQHKSDLKEATERAQRAVVKHEMNRLLARKRSAALAATISGGIGLFMGFLRAAVLTGIGDAESETFAVFIGACGLVAAGFAVAAWVLGVMAQSLQNLVQDASDALSDRATYLAVVVEIQEASEVPMPWNRGTVRKVISTWVDAIGIDTRESVAELAGRVGADDFSKLLLSKGLELDVLQEEIRVDDGRPIVQYKLNLASPSLADDSHSAA